MRWSTTPLKVAPVNGSLTVTSGSAYGWSAWVEVLASAPADLVSVGAVLRTAGYTQLWNVQVGVGAAGAESGIATYTDRATKVDVFYGTSAPRSAAILPIGIAAVPAGSRVAVRVLIGDASTACVVAWQYVQAPVTGSMLTSASPLLLAENPWPYQGSGSGAWTWGAWQQITASTAAAWTVAGWVVGTWGNFPAGAEAQIGVGAAGAESVIATLRQWHDSNYVGLFGHVRPLANPCTAIGAGVRVAVRYRTANGNTFSQVDLAISYIEGTL